VVLEIALLALWIDTFLYGIHFLPSVILFNSGSILDGLAQKKFVFFTPFFKKNWDINRD